MKANILDSIDSGDLTELEAFRLYGFTSLELAQLRASREKHGLDGLKLSILKKRKGRS